LYPEQVKSWQDNGMQANGVVAPKLALSQKREKEKELKLVKKEFQLKDSALAETAAILVLRKKAERGYQDQEVSPLPQIAESLLN